MKKHRRKGLAFYFTHRWGWYLGYVAFGAALFLALCLLVRADGPGGPTRLLWLIFGGGGV